MPRELVYMNREEGRKDAYFFSFASVTEGSV